MRFKQAPNEHASPKSGSPAIERGQQAAGCMFGGPHEKGTMNKRLLSAIEMGPTAICAGMIVTTLTIMGNKFSDDWFVYP
ncbi:MAG: hypothetical protein ACYDH9_21175 [Limisphaerales bacterium]